MQRIVEADPARTSLVLQNQHATAKFWIANNQNIRGAARLRLSADGVAFYDVKVPTDAIYAQTDTEGAELTVITGNN